MPVALLEIIARLVLASFKRGAKDIFKAIFSKEQRAFLQERKQFYNDAREFIEKNRALLQRGTPRAIADKLEQHLQTNSPSAQRIREHYKKATQRAKEFEDKLDVVKYIQKKFDKATDQQKKAIKRIIADFKIRKVTAEELGGYIASSWVSPQSYFLTEDDPEDIIHGANGSGFFVLKTQTSSKEYRIRMSEQFMLTMSTEWHDPGGGGAGSFLWDRKVTPHFIMLKYRGGGAARKARRAKEQAQEAKQYARRQRIKAARRAQASFNKTRQAQGAR